MQKLIALLLCSLLVCVFTGCAQHSRPKSSAHIYEGDAPTIIYHNEPETAGGRVHTY